MANLTISLDESTVRNARIRAISEGTSLSAKVREFLSAYVAGAEAQGAQVRQTSTQRLMQSIADARTLSNPAALDAGAQGASGTLRSQLYADDFRQLARDAAANAPMANKPDA